MRALGGELGTATTTSLLRTLRAERFDVLIADLDRGRGPLLDALAAARAEGVAPPRVLAYLSHVDEALHAAARDAGCEAIPRGRFWRTLPQLLAGVG